MKSAFLPALLHRRHAVRSGSSLLTLALAVALGSSPVHAQGINSTNGLTVTTPNGYAVISRDDMALSSEAGMVRWGRQWDGQEWRFNPHWESLSQSWKNLTGSQSADTTSTTVTSGSSGGAASGSTSGSAGATAVLSSGSSGAGGSGGGCWVWVDEDWQPSYGTAVIGGLPQAEPVQPARLSPFNKVMGEDAQSYAPLQRVSVDYASLCAGAAVSMPPANDVEAIRRNNELYLGDNGRYAFSNRAVLEKREVKQIAAAPAEALYASLGTGRIALSPQANDKGYRWLDKSGDWIDYNTQGQVVAYGDRNNNTVWLARDTGGRLLGVVDPRGRVLYTLHYTGQLLTEVKDHPVAGLAGDLPARSVKYAYDERNRLVQVTDVRGHVTKYDYNVSNRLIKITDAEGRSESLAYTGDAVSRHTAADGAVTDYVFEFDDANKQFISKVTGPQTEAGRRVEDLTHNRAGKLVRQIVNGRTETEVRYDTGARAEIATNARGFSTRTVTNEFEQVVEIAHPDGGVEKRSYSALHTRLIEKTDELGHKTQVVHDGRGNVLKRIDALGTTHERITEYQRNARGEMISLTRKGRTESNGSVTPDATWRFDHDQMGHIRQTIDPEGHERNYVHDRAGNLIAYTDPTGKTRRFEVDPTGNLTKEVDPLGHTRSYAYDKVGNQVRVIDAKNKVMTLGHDALNRDALVVNMVGGTYRIQYNGHGLPITETDEDGRVQQVSYDNFQRLLRQTDGKGNVTEHAYGLQDGSASGALGSLLAPTETRFPTYTEQQRFDERERPTTRTVLNPDGQSVEGLITSRKYDKRGRLIEATNAEGKTSYYRHDPHGKTTHFTNSLGRTVELLWDTRGNLIQVKDANAQVTTFQYDRLNRLLKETLPKGQVRTFTYDVKGNRETVTDAQGNRVRHFFDSADRPTRTEVYKAGEASPEVVYTFTHDEEDRLTGWSDGVRSATYGHDDAGRRTSVIANQGGGVSLSIAYEYTAAGYVKALTYPDGTRVEYTHDAHGQLSNVLIPGEGSIAVNEWNWVAPKKVTLPGGTTSEARHDGLLKLTGVRVRSPGQQTVFDLESRFGKLEEARSRTLTDAVAGGDSTVSTTFTYDSEQRLTQVVRDAGGVFGTTTESFGHDAAGNRVTHSAVNGPLVYDENNRLTQRGSGGAAVTYQYDANGNLVLRTAGAAATRYVYDALNRLVEIQDGAGNVRARYAYDPFDNRIVKDSFVGDQGQLLSRATRTHYLYGDEGLLAESDASGTITTQYGWRPDGDWATDPLFIKTAIQRGGASEVGYAYFHNDHMGTPLRATDKSGQVVWRADYNAFGAASLPTSNVLRNPLRFAGQYADPESGLHHNTRRYYDPEVGRYISADPAGVSGGWNLYDYANGDPVNQLDPTGEWVWVVIRVAMTVYDTYTTYQEIKENGLCFDWTRLIPIPVKIPKIKWLNKRIKKCSNPCECALGGNSFTADTLVHAMDESGQPALRPIAQIRVGDKVLAHSAWKPQGQQLGYEEVSDVHVTPERVRQLVHLTLSNGQVIQATEGHPFQTPEGWRDAILLKKGGQLLIPSREGGAPAWVELSDVSFSQEAVTTYNLEVRNAHTFFVGEQGVLVHNGNGAYTITFPDGSRYHGKGDYNRAKKSARRVGRVTGQYPCPDYEDWIDWEDATDDDDSFKKEHDRLSGDGGPQNTGIGGDGRNHNKIWGPGRKR